MATRYEFTFLEYKQSGIATALSYIVNWIGAIFLLAAGIGVFLLIGLIIEIIKGGWIEFDIEVALIAISLIVAAAIYHILNILVFTKAIHKIAELHIKEKHMAEQPLEPEGRPCPNCGQMIEKTALTCQYCGFVRPK